MKDANEVIEAGNKIIAFFIGAKEIEPIGHMKRNIEFPVQQNGLNVYAEDDLKYHSSFDWLMPCLDKIEALGYDTRVCCVSFIQKGVTKKSFLAEIETVNGVEISYIKDTETKIEAVWLAVIDFIKFYNSQPQNQNNKR